MKGVKLQYASPEKQPTFEKHHSDRSPMKIFKLGISSSYDKESVVVDHVSKITSIANDVGF